MSAKRSLAKLLGGYLRSFRLRQGLTQRELAQRVAGGVDLSYIGRIERGEQLPSLKVLQKLGDALGVPVAEFFGRRPTDELTGGRPQQRLWQAIRRIPAQDLPILLAVARLLARRRGALAQYRGGVRAGRIAAEQPLGYRKRSTRRLRR